MTGRFFKAIGRGIRTFSGWIGAGFAYLWAVLRGLASHLANIQSKLPWGISRIKPGYFTAGVIFILISLWLITGQFGNGEQAAPPLPAAENAQETTPTVRARVLRAEARQLDLILRGKTEALRTVEVKAETAAPVAATPVERGAHVKEGDVLCELEVEARQAMVDQAKADMTRAELEYQAAQKLARSGYKSETQAAAAKAAFEAASATVQRMEVELAHTKITAPFDGVVDDRLADVGDYMRPGDTCAVVMDEDPFLIVAHVSERDVTRLRVGDEARAKLITGEEVTGKVRFVSTRADEGTRTFRVDLEVPNAGGTLRDGVTAEIYVTTQSVNAHRISAAVLSLADDGSVGVRIVENGAVKFVPVEIVAQERDGMWVKGLPEVATVITVGQEYVREGQKVNVVADENGSQS